MAWKFGNKVYRNLEEQVRENQKNSLKNAADIEKLAKKDEIKRVLYFEMSGDEFVGDDKTLPAYGATTLTEYFVKVGYLVAQLDVGDNQFMFALSRDTTDYGFIHFDLGFPSEVTTETIKRITYQIHLNTETDTVEFYFDDFYDYNPYGLDLGQFYDMIYPIRVNYQTLNEGGKIQLRFNGNDMEFHPNTWLQVDIYNNQKEPTYNYLKQRYYAVNSGIVTMGFDNIVPGNNGMFVELSGQTDSDIFDVAYFEEI